MDSNKYKQLIENLPSEIGIQGREKYFNSVVLVSLVNFSGLYSFVLQKRASNIRQGGEICFPGGKFDPEFDKNYKDTAIRETVEELGIAKNKIRIDGRLDTFIAPMGAIVEAYVGELMIDNLSELNVSKDEVEELIIIPFSYFKKQPDNYNVRLSIESSFTDENGNEVILLPVKELGLPDRYEKPWGKKMYNIYLYQIFDVTVWGLTAEIIKEFVKFYKF